MTQKEWLEEYNPTREERGEMADAVRELMQQTGDDHETCFDQIVN